MITPIDKLANTATQKTVKSIEGIDTTLRLIPGKRYDTKAKSVTSVVRAYKANTLINQANRPTVNKFKGKNNTFKSGTSSQLINIKAAAPIAKLLNPPLIVNPGTNLAVTVNETALIKNALSSVFIEYFNITIYNPDMAIPENTIEIIGSGFIGDKADQLLQKREAIVAAGFSIPPTIVLAQDVFEPMIDIARGGKFNNNQRRLFQEVVEQFGNRPLVVRSSAAGDARGSGIYFSEFVPASALRVRYAIGNVLSSYYSESAKAFRKDAATGEGMAVMIQPVVGQVLIDVGGGKSIFAPHYSGFGYSSTAREDTTISIVPGLGGGVNNRDGIDLSLGQARMYGHPLPNRYQAYFHNSKKSFDYIGHDSHELVNGGRWYSDHYYEEDFDFLPLLEKLELLEGKLGNPQYLEWAATLEDNDPRFWMLQIADADIKLDAFHFEDYGDIIYEGGIDVVGSGVKRCNQIVDLKGSSGLNALYNFNQQNSGYIAFLPAFLSSPRQEYRTDSRRLVYADFSNASVVFGNSGERGTLKDHLGTTMDLTNKLYGTILGYRELGLEEEGDVRSKRLSNLEREIVGDGLTIIKGNFTVVASERQNRMIITYQGPISDEVCDDK